MPAGNMLSKSRSNISYASRHMPAFELHSESMKMIEERHFKTECLVFIHMNPFP